MDNTTCNAMKHHLSTPLVLIILFLIISIQSAAASTWFIKPSTEIPIRRGQGTDYRIVAIIPDGTEVSVIEESDSWTKITTSEGKTGWVLKRYLTRTQPMKFRFDALQEENISLTGKLTLLQAENGELEKNNAQLLQDIENIKKQLKSTTNDYETLVNASSDVISMQSSLTQNEETLTRLRSELTSVSAENKRLKASQNIKWFLAGGGTLIFGCIVGMMAKGSKKRRSSLY